MKLVIIALLFSLSGSFADAQDLEVRRAAQQFERTVLNWVQVEGTLRESDAYSKMIAARTALAELGPRGIDEIVILLEHKQDNIRRGSAIALLGIVEEHKLDSQILLDKVLLRMVEDPDLKTRHNLYHVSRKLIAHIRKADRVTEQTVRSAEEAIRQ